MNVEDAVLQRYSEGARERVESLCCPVEYDPDLLKILPQEIIERDYGCGDHSRYVQRGDTVLDLGSGNRVPGVRLPVLSGRRVRRKAAPMCRIIRVPVAASGTSILHAPPG